ncbi:MAG: lasso peptide biosynthesis B2 protein [Bryocella sp.]
MGTPTPVTDPTPTAPANLPEPALHLPLYIAHARIEGGTVVLDLRSGEFLLFDDVASAFWSALLETGISDGDRQQALLARFDADPTQLNADLDVFRLDCLTKGLLVDANPPPPLTKPSRRTCVHIPVWCAWRSLVTVSASLRRFGFAPTYAAAYAASVEHRPHAVAARDLARAERAFAAAENFFVSRSAPNDCLPRSLALFRFLRKMGLPATHWIGFDRYSLSAHAWVECDGRVILDSDRRDTLIPLTRAPL